ncbi:hypothetical protein Noda2021_09180 [Candidatus Dependentiae bacterium Noda2021]|nr:hypothetical protein Noda2021_09180 [Candidatus Dependentiae bacterium Noda2021]
MSRSSSYSFEQFKPLIIITAVIIVLTVLLQLFHGFTTSGFMLDFMGVFFLVFGAFKLANVSAFAKAYKQYDLITQQFPLWGYLYPFIEVTLGVAYLFRFNIYLISAITLILMIIGSIGVYRKLKKKETIACACLGTVFKLPMTYVTLAEDLIMALMAGYMLIF